MKKNRIFILALLFIISSISMISADSEDEVEVDVLFSEVKNADKYGEIEEGPLVDFLGNDINLYIEFKDKQMALDKFESDYSIVIVGLKKEHDLPDLSINTFELYYNAFLNDSATPESKYYYELSLFDSFANFKDIFENDEQNIEIVNKIKNLNLDTEKRISSFSPNQELKLDAKDFANKRIGNDSAVSDELLEIFNLLPMNGERVKEVNSIEENIQLTTKPAISLFGFNSTQKTKAINFASKYAVSNAPISMYQTFSADCTNFASQILEASGISQVPSASEHSGWWHRKSSESIGTSGGVMYTHTHSVSWIRSRTFANYFGKGPVLGPSQYKTFTQLAVAGDFIGKDNQNDGDVDHIGFITAKGSPDNNGVYNLRIAQHTRNYHDWTSSSNNNWEIMEPNNRYYFIRS